MSPESIKAVLDDVQTGALSTGAAMERLKNLPFEDLGFAKLDHHREIRVGYPEVIYCAGKTIFQISEIFKVMLKEDRNILATRANPEIAEVIKKLEPRAEYFSEARIIAVRKKEQAIAKTHIAVVTGGTSDIPVSEEAAVTAEIFGNPVDRIYDVGVAGLHRLMAKIDLIRSARVIIAVAGMEGALVSVLGGLVERPVIAVPTSVGYGANFGGLSALLAMLNSCSSGVSVVNIDNGFGAGYLASMLNRD